MSTKLFDDDDGSFLASICGEEQHSLSPAFAGVPSAWGVVCEANRAVCPDYIKQDRTDIRPKSLRANVAEDSES